MAALFGVNLKKKKTKKQNKQTHKTSNENKFVLYTFRTSFSQL